MNCFKFTLSVCLKMSRSCRCKSIAPALKRLIWLRSSNNDFQTEEPAMSVSSFKITDVIDPRKIPELQPVVTVGIDIGSRQSKAVLLTGDHVHTVITASGVHPGETAIRMVNKLLKVSGVQRSDIARSEEHTSELQSPKDLVCRVL